MEMYKSIVNSPLTNTVYDINASQTSIEVANGNYLPDAPNLATIGQGPDAETILYTVKNANVLSGITRGFQGSAKSWAKNTIVSRNFTSYDHDSFTENITNIQNQLSDVNKQSFTAKQGLQVVTSSQASPLDLTVNGRTLVNLLGVDGNFEIDSGNGVGKGWTKGSQGSYSLETTNIKYGIKAQRIASLSGDTNQLARRIERNISLTAGKFYLIAVDVVTDGVTEARMQFDIGQPTSVSTTTSKTIYIKVNPSVDSTTMLYLRNYATVGSTGWVQFDGFRIYEITAEDFNKIGVVFTDSDIERMFPYVDSVQSLSGVAIQKSGKNLFDRLMPIVSSTATVNSIEIASIIGQQYTLSTSVAGASNVWIGTVANQVSIPVSANNPKTIVATGSNIYVVIRKSDSTYDDVLNRKEIVQLELGSIATPFEPQNNDYIYIDPSIKLASDITGQIKDQLYQRDGKWWLLERWKKDVVLDGSLPWTFYSDYVGYKAIQVTSSSLVTPLNSGVSIINKYDGKILQRKFPIESSDQFLVQPSSPSIIVSIADSESGWAESINPNSDEMSALTNGWKANANDGTRYTSWISVLDGSAPTTNTIAFVKANKAPNWTGWGKLTYQLAKSIETDVTYLVEGAISLHQGSNQIEISSGWITREKVVFNTGTKQGTTSKRAKRILAVYKGNERVAFTTYTSSGSTQPQLVDAVDSAMDYYVSYECLDKYALTTNAESIEATYRGNIKTVVDNLVQRMTDNETRDSVQDRFLLEDGAYIDDLRFDLTQLQEASAKFKKGSSTYTNNTTTQTFIEAFCTADSLVTISITSTTEPQGVWSVDSANGSFTITSTNAESTDITFDYFIQKAV